MDKKGVKRKNDRPMCRYGLSCYQKNPEHRKKYCHPQPVSVKRGATLLDNNTSKFGESSPVQATPANKTPEDEKKVLSQKDRNDEVQSAQTPSSTCATSKFSESVEDILKSMPEDFFEFWKFCSSLNKTKPEDAFAEIGLHLVGVYDLVARNLPKEKKLMLLTHCRYYYDPPEFQTVVKSDDADLYHIGYFRDVPSEQPSVLASNSAAVGPKLTLKGDNIFAAMNLELTERLPKLQSKLANKFAKIHNKLKEYAKEKNYTLSAVSVKTKARQKKVVSKTFHGLGVVVPVKNDVGYRPLIETDAEIKKILNRIVSAESEDKRLEEEEGLDEIITNVHFATDECDFGTALELGIDLFCFGDPYFHSHILNLLPIAYDLLHRSKFSETIRCHLSNRKKSGHLDAFNEK